MSLARHPVLSWLVARSRSDADRQQPDRAVTPASPRDPARLRWRLLDLLAVGPVARHPVLSRLIGRNDGTAWQRAPQSPRDDPADAAGNASGDRLRRRLLAMLHITDVQRRLLDAVPVPVIVTRTTDHKLLHANPPARRRLDGYQGGDGADLWSAVLDEPTRERFLLALQSDTGTVDGLAARWSASGDFANATRLRLSARRFAFGAQSALLTTIGTAGSPPQEATALPATALGNAGAERQALRATLGVAIMHGELRLRYQPRIDSTSGQATSIEALVEWLHPEHGLLASERWERVDPAASAAATVLDPAFAWALAKACNQWRHWQDQGLPGLPISLRVPPGQPLDESLAAAVERSAAAAGLAAGAIELELPEPALPGESEVTRDVLQRLQAAGCSLSVGCFGTGRLSLEALHGLPIDILRIDASLVRALRPAGDGNGDAVAAAPPPPAAALALIGAIVELGRALGMRVGAHGVVHPEEEVALHRAGCDELQGMLYGLPMPSQTCATWLRSRGAAHSTAQQPVETA